MRWVVGGFCGYGGSVLAMGEWAVGYWVVGVTSFQKTRKDSATQLLNR